MKQKEYICKRDVWLNTHVTNVKNSLGFEPLYPTSTRVFEKFKVYNKVNEAGEGIYILSSIDKKTYKFNYNHDENFLYFYSVFMNIK